MNVMTAMVAQIGAPADLYAAQHRQRRGSETAARRGNQPAPASEPMRWLLSLCVAGPPAQLRLRGWCGRLFCHVWVMFSPSSHTSME